MPRQMPALATRFAAEVDRALDLAEAGERARTLAGPRTPIARVLHPARLEALYELAYLRIFVTWEVFLEDVFLRMLCGYSSAIYVPAFQVGKVRSTTLADARVALLSGARFLLWHNPQYLVDRGGLWFVGCPHEAVARSSFSEIQWLSYVRHRIAHGSDDTKAQFDTATMNFAARRYRGASAGRFLRDWDTSKIPQQRWLWTLADKLKDLSLQIAP